MGPLDEAVLHAEIARHVSLDQSAERREYAFCTPWLAGRLASRLRDARDRPILELYCNILLCTLPSAVLVFAQPGHWTGAAHLALNYLLFLERYLVALLHVTEHRTLFTSGASGLCGCAQAPSRMPC